VRRLAWPPLPGSRLVCGDGCLSAKRQGQRIFALNRKVAITGRRSCRRPADAVVEEDRHRAARRRLLLPDDKVLLFSPAPPPRDTLDDLGRLCYNDTWLTRPDAEGWCVSYGVIRDLARKRYEDWTGALENDQSDCWRNSMTAGLNGKALNESPKEKTRETPEEGPHSDWRAFRGGLMGEMATQFFMR